MNFNRYVLTYNCEMDEMREVRRRRHLTLVHAGVSVLRILDLQNPVLRVRLMNGPKPLIARVSVASHGEKMDVPMSNPRHLQRHLKVTYRPLPTGSSG
ncbi:hypothetical protein JTB14_002470 [Gonioctena quinquepunctata]|nr:hypothetical protein JTB14_002470 [Gonioctena quinquepunctata]